MFAFSLVSVARSICTGSSHYFGLSAVMLEMCRERLRALLMHFFLTHCI